MSSISSWDYTDLNWYTYVVERNFATYKGQVPNILQENDQRSDIGKEEAPSGSSEGLGDTTWNLNRVRDYEERTSWTLGYDVST